MYESYKIYLIIFTFELVQNVVTILIQVNVHGIIIIVFS